MKIYPTSVDFRPDNKRVVVRPFISTDPNLVRNIIGRALSLSEAEVEAELAGVRTDFCERHIDLDKSWLRHFEMVKLHLQLDVPISETRRLYIGALFSGEYALESAALFNPSIVAHPDQSGVAEGDLRFILSLRATGEGHISSIEFRAGLLHRDHTVDMEKTTPFVTLPELDGNPTFHRTTFLHKLEEMGLENGWSAAVMAPLGVRFTLSELEASMLNAAGHEPVPLSRDVLRTMECMRWLAEANYQLFE